MKNKGIWALVSIIVLLGLLLGSFACAASEPTSIPTPQVTLKPTPTPEPTPTSNSSRVIADGHLSFVEERRLTFGISGKVGQVDVRVMDRVTKGQVLAKLDTTSLERAVKASEIVMKAAEIAAKSAEAGLKQAQGNLESAQIDLDLATNEHSKIAYPYTYKTFAFNVPTALGFISDARRQINDAATGLQVGLPADKYDAVSSQLEKALNSLTKSQGQLRRGTGVDVFESGYLPVEDFWTMRAAQLQVDKAQLAIDNASAALDRAQLAVDNANNNVDRAKNDLDKARDELDKAVIIAPFDGAIAKVNVKEGDFLSDDYASTTVIEIINPSRMELNVNVDELAILNIKLGQEVTIILDVLPDKWFKGVVTSISPLPMGGTSRVSYEVKTVFDVPQDLALKAGMRGWADINT
ncbi:HlyD family secretion protein [Chloroflexota bacterium]